MSTSRIAIAALIAALAASAAIIFTQDAAATTTLPVTQQDDADVADDKDKAEVRIGDPYTLTTCAVSGKELGSMGEPITLLIEGREAKLCCKGCIKRMKTEPAKYFAKVDEALIADQLRIYPIKTCIVSGEPLVEASEDSEDAAVNIIVGNRLFRVCCNMCATKVQKDPTKYFAKLDAAVIKAQSEHYPLEMCLVRGKSKLGSMGDPDQLVVANRLVQFCCAGCRPKFAKDPAKYLAKLDAAWLKQHEKQGDAKGGHSADGGH